MKATRVLIVDDEPGIRESLSGVLGDEGFQCAAVESGEAGLEELARNNYDVVLLDVWLPGLDGLETLARIQEIPVEERPEVIIISGHGTIETAVKATKLGAFDFLEKPLTIEKVTVVIHNAVEQRRLERELARLKGSGEGKLRIIGESVPMKALRQQLALMSATNGRVLIFGESGTGKELIAQMIHRNSRRAQNPFVPVDCGAITPSLLESELFGALKGAYTGADRDRIGVFEAANNGTVFLDEIGDIELGFQLKLLRFLQEREIRPLGSPRSRKIDVRVIAATNRDVQKMVEDGKFREDLWYRLNVVRLTIPPLCERASDIPLLAHYFLKRYNERYRLDTRLTESGLKTMEAYSWPGNIRQLQHMMERLTILAPAGRIDAAAVQSAIEQMDSRDHASDSLADTETEQIRRVMAATNGNKSRAAKILGIERKTLYRKLERMGM